MRLLHRHPAELTHLAPHELAEVLAVDARQSRNVCPTCTRKALAATLRRTCDECGQRYEDAATKASLKAMDEANANTN